MKGHINDAIFPDPTQALLLLPLQAGDASIDGSANAGELENADDQPVGATPRGTCVRAGASPTIADLSVGRYKRTVRYAGVGI